MQLFPAIDLRGGKVVRLTQGDYSRMTVYGEDPCAQAREFLAAGAKNLHVVDLDGAKDGTLSNYDTIAALAKQGGLYIEVGGGIRTEERIETYLSIGVGRCILGSVAVTDFAFTARMLKKYGDKNCRGRGRKGRLCGHPWLEGSERRAGRGLLQAAGRCRMHRHHLHGHCLRRCHEGNEPRPVPHACQRGARRGLYGQRRHLVRSRASETEKMGTAAAILGKSLYAGALDLARCVQLVQE